LSKFVGLHCTFYCVALWLRSPPLTSIFPSSRFSSIPPFISFPDLGYFQFFWKFQPRFTFKAALLNIPRHLIFSDFLLLLASPSWVLLSPPDVPYEEIPLGLEHVRSSTRAYYEIFYIPRSLSMGLQAVSPTLLFVSHLPLFCFVDGSAPSLLIEKFPFVDEPIFV